MFVGFWLFVEFGAKLQGFLVYQAFCFVHAREEPSFEDLVVRFQLRV